jgi:hypothetical protein
MFVLYIIGIGFAGFLASQFIMPLAFVVLGSPVVISIRIGARKGRTGPGRLANFYLDLVAYGLSLLLGIAFYNIARSVSNTRPSAWAYHVVAVLGMLSSLSALQDKSAEAQSRQFIQMLCALGGYAICLWLVS